MKRHRATNIRAFTSSSRAVRTFCVSSLQSEPVRIRWESTFAREQSIRTQQDRRKREFLGEWTNAVNTHGGFGQWSWDVSLNPGDIKDILARHARVRPSAEKAVDDSQSQPRSAAIRS